MNIAIVGATGAVGHAFLTLLSENILPIHSLRLFASERSVGKKIQFQGQDLLIEPIQTGCFKTTDIAFFSAGAGLSKTVVPQAVREGAVVIDNSSAFRLDENVPLVVPECNPEDAFTHNGIIANPNCSTTQMVVALKPLQQAFGLKTVWVATYQAVSGSGATAMQELEQQLQSRAAKQPLKASVYPAPIVDNLIPQVDAFLDNGYTKEEMKIVYETRRILHDPDLKISATCVRVPISRAHSEAISVETLKPATAQQALAAFKQAKGIIVKNGLNAGEYPMPLYVSHQKETFVGRVRQDLAFEQGIAFWCVADQLYKGAAYNAIQIAELLTAKNGKLSAAKNS